MLKAFFLEKKNRFLLQSFVLGVLVFLFSYSNGGTKLLIAVFAVLATVVGTFLTQYPNVDFRNILINLLLPLHLVLGAMLSLIYFPNLGLPIKIVSLVAFIGSFYVISLVSNVFLVVEDKNETIPLYRAALAWNQIILIVIAIPFFAGVFKLPLNGLFQSTIVSTSSFMFAIYLMWILAFDKNSRSLKVGEQVLFGLFVSFLVFACSVLVSFIPTESFLRAIFVSSALLFGLNYVQSHTKNTINRNLVLEYFIISIIFFLLLLVFKP